MTNSDKMLVLSTIRQVEIERVATWILEEMIADLDKLRRDTAAAILAIDVTGTARADFQRSRLTKLLGEIDDLAKSAFSEIEKRMVAQVAELQAIQVDDEKRNWLLVYGLAFVGAVTIAARKLLVFGTPLQEELRNVRDDFIRRSSGIVRQSAANLEPSAVTASKVNGDVVGGTGSVSKPSASALERVTRTATAASANKAASDIMPPARAPELNWVHVSILDGRTSAPCRQRAFKRWDSDKQPLGHSLPFQEPPIHPPPHPCRSFLRRYFAEDGPPKERNFKEFLDDLLTPAQQSQVFGAKALGLWRKGLLTDSQLIRQESRPLSLDALRKITETKGETQKEFPFL